MSEKEIENVKYKLELIESTASAVEYSIYGIKNGKSKVVNLGYKFMGESINLEISIMNNEIYINDNGLCHFESLDCLDVYNQLKSIYGYPSKKGDLIIKTSESKLIKDVETFLIFLHKLEKKLNQYNLQMKLEDAGLDSNKLDESNNSKNNNNWFNTIGKNFVFNGDNTHYSAEETQKALDLLKSKKENEINDTKVSITSSHGTVETTVGAIEDLANRLKK